jgi:hypothetical protein
MATLSELMKRKRLLIITLGLLVSIGVFTGYLIPKNTPILAHFLNKNSMKIKVKNGLDMDSLNIQVRVLEERLDTLVVFQNGQEYPIPKSYGKNKWFLSYGKHYVGIFSHFKTNNWHDHHYTFVFYKEDKNIFCDAKISGPDQMETITIELETQ